MIQDFFFFFFFFSFFLRIRRDLLIDHVVFDSLGVVLICLFGLDRMKVGEFFLLGKSGCAINEVVNILVSSEMRISI